MKRRFKFIYIMIIVFVIYCLYKLIDYYKYEYKIKTDKALPKIELSQLIKIDETRIKYITSVYYENQFIGFDAVIDDQQYVTVIKLGKADHNVNVSRTLKNPTDKDYIAIPPTDVNDIGRFVNFRSYPFNNINTFNYYIEGKELKTDYSSGFKEIEMTSTFINIAFGKNIDINAISYVSPKKQMSISFINYQKELYILNTFPINKAPYKSLHDLCGVK